MNGISAEKIAELEEGLKKGGLQSGAVDVLTLVKGTIGGSSQLEGSLLALVIGSAGRELILKSREEDQVSEFGQARQYRIVDIWALEMALRSLIIRASADEEAHVLLACVRLGKRLLEVVSSALTHFGVESGLPIASVARNLNAAERDFDNIARSA